jgi:hypothetical protein
MIQPFDAVASDTPRYIGKFDGWIILWAFAPIWIGESSQALQKQGTPPGGFNFEVRDGIYWQNQIGPSQASNNPLVIPWVGELWLCNGKAPTDSINNVVIIKYTPNCS